MPPNGLVDLRAFGRRLRSARILAGYDTVALAALAIFELTGVSISDRTFYAIERGEQMPSLEQFMAFTITFKPPYMWQYWNPAFPTLVLEHEVHDLHELPQKVDKETEVGLPADGRQGRRPGTPEAGRRRARPD